MAESTDHPLERLVFFSDAVFAIAITLLVIEIEIPSLAANASTAEAWHELGTLLPSIVAFLLSFLVIGRFWMGHHRLFTHVTRHDDRLMWPNLLFLLSIAFMPFATGFLGRNFGHFVPALLYNSTMLVCALLNVLVARTAIKADLLDSDFERQEFRARPLGLSLGAATCIVLTFFLPLISQIGMATVPIWQRLLRPKAKA